MTFSYEIAYVLIIGSPPMINTKEKIYTYPPLCKRLPLAHLCWMILRQPLFRFPLHLLTHDKVLIPIAIIRTAVVII